jgi:hypothetical protein
MSLPRLLATRLAVLGAVAALVLVAGAARAVECHYEGHGVLEEGSGGCFIDRIYYSCLEDDGSLNMCYDTVQGCFTDDGRWFTFTLTSLGGDCSVWG